MADEEPLKCHPLSQHPNAAWDDLKPSQSIKILKTLSAGTPVKPDHVRFVCISDTHSRTSHMKHPIPPGDVLLHAGDFTTVGRLDEVREFNDFLGSLPHTYKVVIAGNHDMCFDQQCYSMYHPYAEVHRDPRELLTNCIYLEDSLTEVYGITIYGTPWQPRHDDWAFNLSRGEACMKKWNQIPSNVDVLLTHTPPLGYGDYAVSKVHAGCVDLLQSIQRRIKPKYHVYGHIHEGYGVTTDGVTVFINCAICDVRYVPKHKPVVFDIPLKNGYKKL